MIKLLNHSYPLVSSFKKYLLIDKIIIYNVLGTCNINMQKIIKSMELALSLFFEGETDIQENIFHIKK